MEARAPVRAEVVEGIALVTFAAPPRNIATTQTWAMLAERLAGYADDPAVRVVVLTGAGHHAFLADPLPDEVSRQEPYEESAREARAALAAFTKPIIARVRGECIGTGLLVALHADLVIAAEDSTFALPAARWGMAYPPDAVAALVRLVGPQHAKRMLFVGGRMGAREALRIGLVTLVVDDADLSDIVVDLARAIADNGPLAVAATKRIVASPDDASLLALVEGCRASADHAAGMEAAQRGRVPVFGGR